MKDNKCPQVSIIIPSYMKGEYLGDAIESALNQTHPAKEILVLAMDKESYKVASGFNTIKVFREERMPLPHARNYLIERTTAPWFISLDGDDALKEDFIEEVTKHKADVVYTNYQFTGLFNHYNPCMDEDNIGAGSLLFSNDISCTALISKEAWKKVGGFWDEMVYGCEDREFWINLLAKGHSFKKCTHTYFYYRQTSNSMVRTIMAGKIGENINKIRERHGL